MKILAQKAEILNVSHDNPVLAIAQAFRICYQSKSKDYKTDLAMINSKIKIGHMTPLEHVSVTAKLLTDRGVMAELTRHRLASFNVQSSRYVKQKDGVEFIEPVGFDNNLFGMWVFGMISSEKRYLQMIRYGARPEQARSVLPTSAATRIEVTANLREWLHIFKLRCHRAAHPQMVDLMNKCKDEMFREIPEMETWYKIVGGDDGME